VDQRASRIVSRSPLSPGAPRARRSLFIPPDCLRAQTPGAAHHVIRKKTGIAGDATARLAVGPFEELAATAAPDAVVHTTIRRVKSPEHS